MANRWRLGLPAAALIFAALLAIPYLIASAQAQSPDLSCPECNKERQAIADQQLKLASLEVQLSQAVNSAQKIANAVLGRKGQIATASEIDALSKLDADRRQLEAKVSDARDAVAKLKDLLAACIKEHCPASKANAQAGKTITHTYPESACPKCDGLAKNAKVALATLIDDEAAVATTRLRIFELKAWLSAHASDKNTDAYKSAAKDLGGSESDLKAREAERVEAQRDFDARMADLAKCNANPDCNTGATTPLDRPPFYPVPEVKAKCANCDGHALELEADIARLRRAELRLALDEDRLRELINSAKTKKESEEIEEAKKDLENVLQVDKNAIVNIAKVIDSDVKALNDCNAKCEKTTTGQNVLQDGATGPQTSGVTTPQVGPSSTNLPNGTSTPETGVKGGTEKQTVTPLPGGPSATPQPPSGNAPQLGIPSIGSIFGPTPGTFPGVQGFNVSLPFVEQDDDEDYCELVEYFTFEVRGDERFKNDLLEHPFFADKDVISSNLESGIQVTVSGGANPGKTYEFLKNLLERGLIKNLDSELDVCWRAAAGGSIVPVAGAWVLYTPVSPTPSSDPGERPGDEGPPTAVRVGRDGTYSAPPGGLDGPIEIRVAKGGRERTTVTSARSDRTPLAGGTRPFETSPHSNQRIADTIRAGELGKP